MFIGCGALRADLAGVKAEPNLEKRSRAALENAERALKDGRKAYQDGNLEQTKTLLEEVRESVVLAEASLEETGKNPIKSPKYFKNAEIRTSDLVRRLDSFEQDMNVADRPMVQPVKEKVQEVHERLLREVMMGKKK